MQYAAGKTANIFLFNSMVEQSMSRKGNCWDNAMAESFFKTIKCELVYLYEWTSYGQAFRAIADYIYWYNTKRLHQDLGYLTPLEKEKQLRNMLNKKAA